MELKKRRLIRIIIPRFPKFNIYTIVARTTTSVGPLYVATSASKLDCWDAEVIDENNLHGRFYPRTREGYLDHRKLQEKSPADVVGFYGSITASIPHLFDLAKMYKAMGCMTIAGGKHVENLPGEALENGIDYVFFKEAEISIRKFLQNFDNPSQRNLVEGIGYLKDHTLFKTLPQTDIEDLDCLPIPDFNLLRFAKMKLYPISGTRGCGSNCEFCTVKGKPRSCSAQAMMDTIKVLVEKYHAKHFFDVSDNFASNRSQAIQFLNLFAEYQKEIHNKLYLSIQARITDAKSNDYLAALKRARVDTVCIGFESPLDENLSSMQKGYLSKNMLAWARMFKKQRVRIHGMFIFAYPPRNMGNKVLDVRKITEEYWHFIKRSHLGTLQVLLAIPLPGTELRERLKNSKKLFPIEDFGWEYYDGQFPLYDPGMGAKPEEIQQAVGKLNRRFYGISSLFRLTKNILFDFPLIVFPSVFTLVSGRVLYIQKAFRFWHGTFF